MPIVTVTYAGAREAACKAKLIHEVTDVVAKELNVPASAVEVILQQVEPAHWGVGGVGLDVIFAQREKARGGS